VIFAGLLPIELKDKLIGPCDQVDLVAAVCVTGTFGPSIPQIAHDLDSTGGLLRFNRFAAETRTTIVTCCQWRTSSLKCVKVCLSLDKLIALHLTLLDIYQIQEHGADSSSIFIGPVSNGRARTNHGLDDAQSEQKCKWHIIVVATRGNDSR
jgi:hypothetical protein